MRSWFRPRTFLAVWTFFWGVALSWAVVGQGQTGAPPAVTPTPGWWESLGMRITGKGLLHNRAGAWFGGCAIVAIFLTWKCSGWLARRVRRRFEGPPSPWNRFMLQLLHGPAQAVIFALWLNALVGLAAAAAGPGIAPPEAAGWTEQLSEALIYLVGALLAARRLDGWLEGRLKRWVENNPSRWNDIIVGLFKGPAQAVCFVILLNLGVDVLEWGGAARQWAGRVSEVLVAVSLFLVLLKAVDAVIEIWRSRLPADADGEFNHHFLLLVAKLSKAVVGVVAVLTLLSELNVDIKAALASVSVVGLALGLAAQDTVANLFGAVAVFVDRPFKIGDRIKVGDVDGNVESIGVRATRVRSLDGYLITVPNKTIGSNTVINVSSRPTIRTDLNYGLTYDTPAARVKEAATLLESIFRAHPKSRDVVVTFDKFLDSSLNLNVVYWCAVTDGRVYSQVLQEIQLAIKAQFDAAGFDFAFPSQTTYHKFPDGAAAPPPVS